MTDDSKHQAIRDVGKFEEYFTSLTVSPGKQVNPKTLKGHRRKPRTLDEKVNQFEDSFTVWSMRYARLLTYGKNEDVGYCALNANSPTDTEASINRTVNDSGFAVLSLVNPYVEVIGRLCGDFPKFPYKDDKPNECIPTGKFVEAGLLHMLPELKTRLDSRRRKKVIELFRMAVRNSMAHTYWTGANVFLSRSQDEIILVGTFGRNTAISINPQALFACVSKHFTGYVEKLRMRNSSDEAMQLQEQFNERYPDGLKLCTDRKKQKAKK